LAQSKLFCNFTNLPLASIPSPRSRFSTLWSAIFPLSSRDAPPRRIFAVPFANGCGDFQDCSIPAVLLSKQLLHRPHRQEEPPLNLWKLEKPILLVKGQSRGILRINHDASGSQFSTVNKSSIEPIHQ